LWNKCINVSGGYGEKYIFFQRSNCTCLTFYINLWHIYWFSLVTVKVTNFLIFPS
jgi:hypothetical protein